MANTVTSNAYINPKALRFSDTPATDTHITTETPTGREEEAKTPSGDYSETGYNNAHLQENSKTFKIDEALEKGGDKEDPALRASWIEASREAYRMQYGEEPPARWDDQDLAEWGLGYIRDFNNVIVSINPWGNSMAGISAKLKDASPQQKVAFGYLMDTLDKSSMSGSGAGAFALDMLSDGTTYLGLATFGVGTAAAVASKEALKLGAKNLVREAIKQSIKNTAKYSFTKEGRKLAATEFAKSSLKTKVITASAVAGAEGMVMANFADRYDQSAMISIGRQDGFSWGQNLAMTGLGGVSGAALGTGGYWARPLAGAVGEALLRPVEAPLRFVWNTGTKAWGASSGLTKSAYSSIKGFKPGNFNLSNIQKSLYDLKIISDSGNMLPHPQRTWIHSIVSDNPYTMLGRLFPRVNNPGDVLPNELAFDAFIIPFINKVDDQLIGAKSQNNVASLIVDLQKRLGEVSSRVERGSNPLTSEQAKQQSVKIVKEFLDKNGTALRAFEKDLGPISDEMELETNLAAILRDRREGLLAKETTEKKGISADEAETEARRLIKAYKDQTGHEFHGEEKRIKSIASGAKQEFFLEHGQAAAMSEHVNSIQRAIRVISDPDYIKSLEAGLDKIDNKDVKSIQNALINDFELLTEHSKGAILRSDPENRAQSQSIIWQPTKNRLQDVNRLRIALRNGYSNPYKRTLDVQKPPQPDNAEAIIMDIEGMDPTDASKADELEGLLKQAYQFGMEHEALEAIKRLNMLSDRSKKHQLLDKLVNNMTKKPSHMANGGEHYEHYINTATTLSSVPHNPDKWGQRNVYAMYTRMSYVGHHARKFPGPGSTLSTPGKISIINNPTIAVGKWLIAYPTGGKIRMKPDADGVSRPAFHYFDDLPEDAKGMAKFKHYAWGTTKISVNAVKNITMLPIKPGYEATKFLAKNHVVRNSTLYPLGAGAILIGAEEGLEAVLPEQETFLTDENGNLIVPRFVPVIGGADWDIGSRVGTKWALTMTDGVLTPIRWNVGVIDDWIPEEKLGYDIKAEHFSTDKNPFINLHEVNATFSGDREYYAYQEPTAEDLGALEPAGGGVQIPSAGGTTTYTAGQRLTEEDILAFDDARKQYEALLPDLQAQRLMTQAQYNQLNAMIKAGDDSKATKAQRDQMEKSLDATKANETRINGEIDKVNLNRAIAATHFKTQDITDPSAKAKIGAFMIQLYTANPDIDLMDDKYFAQAEKWAAAQQGPTSRDIKTFARKGIVTASGSRNRSGSGSENDSDTGADKAKGDSITLDETFDAAGGLATKAGSAYGSMFDWMGGDSGTMGQIGTVIGGALNYVTGFFGDLKDGRIENGQKWFAGIIAGILALFITPQITSRLGFFGKIPGMGLLVGAGILAGGGKLIHSMIAKQGNGDVEHAPKIIQDAAVGATVVKHTEEKGASPAFTMKLREDEITPGTDSDNFDSLHIGRTNDGSVAIQLTDDNGKTWIPTDVPKTGFEAMLTNKDAIIIPDHILKRNGLMDEAEEFKAEAINPNGEVMEVNIGGKEFMFVPQATHDGPSLQQ